MWLPTSVYEWLPTSYVIIGVLFVVGAIYIGFSAPFAPIYVGLGVSSILVGFLVQYKRYQFRKENRGGTQSTAKTTTTTSA